MFSLFVAIVSSQPLSRLITFMYQIDQSFVERLICDGCDAWTIELWSKWLGLSREFNSSLAAIAEAFSNVKLGDGIGMLEADGIDNYVGPEDRASRRERDERRRWQSISSTELNANYCSFWFCDAKGGLFLLPAFLLADLRDEYDFNFVGSVVRCITVRRCTPLPAWIDKLNEKQRSALCNVFELLKFHPDFHSRQDKLSTVVASISNPKRTECAG